MKICPLLFSFLRRLNVPTGEVISMHLIARQADFQGVALALVQASCHRKKSPQIALMSRVRGHCGRSDRCRDRGDTVCHTRWHLQVWQGEPWGWEKGERERDCVMTVVLLDILKVFGEFERLTRCPKVNTSLKYTSCSPAPVTLQFLVWSGSL